MGPLESRDAAGVLSSIATIIREAATSQLGILALLIVIAGGAGLVFFYRENVKYRLAVFVLLSAGAAMFGFELLSAQQKLTLEKLSDASAANPKVGEFSVRLQFPEGAPIPDSVDTFIQPRGQPRFVALDSQSFQRSDDPANRSVGMTYLQLPARAVLRIVATGGGKKWGANDIHVPETMLQMAQK